MSRQFNQPGLCKVGCHYHCQVRAAGSMSAAKLSTSAACSITQALCDAQWGWHSTVYVDIYVYDMTICPDSHARHHSIGVFCNLPLLLNNKQV